MFTPQSGNRDRSFRNQNVPFLPPDTILPAKNRGKFTVVEKESPLRADSAELRRVTVSATPSPQGESLDPAAASAAGALPSTRLFATPGPHTDTHSLTHSHTHVHSHTQRSSPSPLSLSTPLSSLPVRSPHSSHSSQGSRTARKTSPPQRFQYTPPAADFMAQVASLFDDDEDHQDTLSSSPSPPVSPSVSVSFSPATNALPAVQSQNRKNDAVPINASTHVVIPTSAPVWRETSPSSPPSSSEHKLVFIKRNFPPPHHNHPQSLSPQRALPPFDGETSERDAEISLSGSDADDFDDRYYRQLRDRLSQMYTPLITQPEIQAQTQAQTQAHTPLLSSLLQNAQQEIEQVQRTQAQMQAQTSPAQKKIDTLLQSLLTRIEQSGERDREQESVDPEVDRQAQELLRFESLARRPAQALGATSCLSSALETELLSPEIQAHLAFLRSLDEQFETNTDDPQRLLEKFLLLPVGEVQSLAFRQHDELVARGIFDEKNILQTWIS